MTRPRRLEASLTGPERTRPTAPRDNNESRHFEEDLTERGVVVVGSSRCHERLDELLDHGMTGAGLWFSASRGDDPEVLRIKRGAESRFVVTRQDALAMHFEHPAGREASEQRLSHLYGIDASLARQRNASLTTARAPPITIWLQTLQSCPAPESPMSRTRSGFPIASIVHFRERPRIASHHDRQRRVDRADFAATDRGVEHRGAER